MVKVTPAHDPNDFEIGQRHGLPSLLVLDEQGRVTAHGPFQGLDRFEARPAVVAALREEGRLVAERRPYVHSVGHCSRCGTVVEPRLSLQWWVRVGPLAKAAGDAVRDGRVVIHPAEMEGRWFSWVDHMHDWCVSRQLWWGHRIPVWYGPDGEVVCVGPDDDVPTGPGWHQDPDVLDTWFSSALWPFSTLGWPDDAPALAKFYPNQVLVTGYDILFFWVARMMMFGLYARADQPPADAVPFRTVALHGMVRDEHGKKMSKSFGNAVDPIEWLDRFGADAVRFTLARGANPGTDVPVGETGFRPSRNFCNKLWNATRFALLNGAHVGALPPVADLSAPDRWILSRLNATAAAVDAFYEDFQFAKALRSTVPLRLGRVLRLVCRAGQVAARRRWSGGGTYPTGARPCARHSVAAAASAHPVRHREALDDADRRGVGRDRELAPGRRLPGRCGSRDRRRRDSTAGHRGPPVPQRPGTEAASASDCAAHRAGRGIGRHP